MVLAEIPGPDVDKHQCSCIQPISHFESKTQSAAEKIGRDTMGQAVDSRLATVGMELFR